MARIQKEPNDKFYTKPSVAKTCLELLDLEDYSLIVEPSAGSGAFSSQIPGCLAYDLLPEGEGIEQANWFDVELPKGESILVVGNPPFGKQNSLAISFIRHATAQRVKTIAFILPRSFRKESLQNTIDKRYHLREELELPRDSFELRGESYPLPCVFQIWDLMDKPRKKSLDYEAVGFRFVAKESNPDLAIRRVGSNAGRVYEDWQNRSGASHYFVAMNPGFSAESLKKSIAELPHMAKDDSVGPRSISKKELLRELYESGSIFAKLQRERQSLLEFGSQPFQ